MARSTQFPSTITRSTIIYDIVSPGAAGLSINVTFLGIIFGLQSDAAFYYLRLDQYSLSVGMFWFYVRCHT